MLFLLELVQALEGTQEMHLAMQENYQLSLNDFLYGKNTAIHHVKLHEKETSIMDFFNTRFMIEGGEKILPN